MFLPITLSGNSSKNCSLTISQASSSFSIVDQVKACLPGNLFAGHWSKQTPQPVQSLQYTWTLNFSPFAFGFASIALNDSGAFFISSASTNFVLIAAWGHAEAQTPHCKQNSLFQWGTLGAIPLFSRHAVPVGITPSTLIAETGMSSPFCLIDGSMIFLAKSSALSGINLTSSAEQTPSNEAGITTSWQASTAASINAKFMFTTSSPFFLKVFLVISLMPS